MNLKKLYFELFLLISLPLLLWWGVAKLKLFPETIEIGFSAETETEIGNEIVSELIGTYGIVESPTVDSAIAFIMDRLLVSLSKPKFSYRIYVVDNKDVNALSTLGGNIIVFSGLIENSGNAEQVAAVIAHEIGHGERRHVARILTRVIGLNSLIMIATGGSSSVLSNAMAAITTMAFSRTEEAEADEFAYILLERAQIAPSALADFFETMLSNGSIPEDGFNFLASHPASKERIQNARDYVLPTSFHERPIAVNWERVKSSLH